MISNTKNSTKEDLEEPSQIFQKLYEVLGKLIAAGVNLKDLEFLGERAREKKANNHFEQNRQQALHLANDPSDLKPHELVFENEIVNEVKANVDPPEDKNDEKANSDAFDAAKLKQCQTKQNDDIDKQEIGNSIIEVNADTHENLDHPIERAKQYNVDMDKVFKCAKNRGKLDTDQLPQGPSLSRLVTAYKNSLRFQATKHQENDSEYQMISRSHKLRSVHSIDLRSNCLELNVHDSNDLSDLEDQILGVYLLMKRGLKKFKSAEQHLR